MFLLGKVFTEQLLLLLSLEQVASDTILGRSSFNVFELFIPKPCTTQFHGDQSKLRPVVTSTVSMFSLKGGGNIHTISGKLIAEPTMCAPVSIFLCKTSSLFSKYVLLNSIIPSVAT
jgi:hypothetical protein